jgi:hypothetical protein
MSEAIEQAIESRELPADKAALLNSLTESGGKYVSQEGLSWDFKRDWPFSYSDDYFASIARLICAFANGHGGIIVFGVHDADRTAGHNKVAPNLDRLQQALKQLLSDLPQLVCRRYDQGTSNAVDVLPIRPYLSGLPLRFTRAIGAYKAGVIWIRQNHTARRVERARV